MNKQERRVRNEISEILSSKDAVNRDKFVKELNDFLYTEVKKVNNAEMEMFLREKNQHVYII